MKYMIGLLILVLLVITGCTGYRNVDTIENYRRGYAGAEISFVRNAPPQELIENSLFSIGIQVHNKGATDIRRGYLTLNYDTDYIELFSGNSKTISLEGRSPFNRNGEFQAYFFESKTKALDAQSLRRNIPIIASLCYEYNTTFVDVICLDYPYQTSTERGAAVCKLQDKSYNGQGGPVGIQSIDITIGGTGSEGILKPIFDITLRHSGQGIILDPDNYLGGCTARGSTQNINQVKITSATLSDLSLQCNSDVVMLRDGTARLRCELTQGVYANMLPFQAPLAIELDYSYMVTQTQNMLIIKG